MSRSGTASSSLHPLVTNSPLVETGNYYCPFLERGHCRNQSQCNFSHDNQTSTKIPTDYCHFYLANKCFYGPECKFTHSEPNSDRNLRPRLPGESAEDADDYYENNVINLYNGPEGGNQHDLPIDKRRGARYYQDYDDENYYEQEEDSCDYESEDVHQSQDGYQIRALYASHNEGFGWLADGHHKRNVDESENNYANPQSSPGKSRHQSNSTDEGATHTNHIPDAASTTSITATQSAMLALLSSPSCSKSRTQPSPQPKNDFRPCASTTRVATGNKDDPLCPYSLASGECPFPNGRCNYLHGLICDLCCNPCLHPFNEEQRLQHRDECLLEHEREMELSFAIQRSRDKQCGICMDTVVEKQPIITSRFGILEKCNHIFCLDCIRKWRGTKQFDNRTVRACPECRVSSDFVVPSKYWVEDQEDKKKLIRDYKAALRSKPCRYFDEGKGDCPFAGSCFYKHAYPDGRLAVMDAPKPRRRIHYGRGPSSSVANYILWNLLTSADDDDWSNESIYLEPELGTDEDEEDDDDNNNYDDDEDEVEEDDEELDIFSRRNRFI